MDPAAPKAKPEPEEGVDVEAVPAQPIDAVDEETARLETRIHALQAAGRRGTNWFYWVAGLSLVNSLLMHVGAHLHFVVGLGVSLVADLVADALAKDHPAQAVIFRAVAIAFAVLAAGTVVLFGWLANKRYLVAFVVAMILYLLDGLLLLLFQDWLSVAFHGYALICLWNGFLAYRNLNKIEKELRQRALPRDEFPE